MEQNILNNNLAESSTKQESFLQKHWQKLVAVVIWLLLAAAYFIYASANNLGLLDAFIQLVNVMQNSFYGPLIYIGIYMLRPLTFFSALILTVAGGFLFGPIWGILYTAIGSNLSATVAYLIGQYLGKGLLEIDESDTDSIITRYATRMRESSFETVFIMRLIFLPYDLVNYLAGFLRIDLKAFILATVLGSIPGTIAFVLFGASIEGEFDGTLPEFDYRVLIASVVIFIISLGISRYMKRREQNAH